MFCISVTARAFTVANIPPFMTAPGDFYQGRETEGRKPRAETLPERGAYFYRTAQSCLGHSGLHWALTPCSP